MPDGSKQRDPIPDEFSSREEAAEFWDKHDTTAYPEAFSDVEVQVQLRGRMHEIDIDEDVMELLRREARKKHMRPGLLASRLLREGLTHTNA